MGKAYRFYALCSKTSAQELHFFNILVGDMSLVGTRPPTLDEWEKFDMDVIKAINARKAAIED